MFTAQFNIHVEQLTACYNQQKSTSTIVSLLLKGPFFLVVHYYLLLATDEFYEKLAIRPNVPQRVKLSTIKIRYKRNIRNFDSSNDEGGESSSAEDDHYDSESSD